MIQIVEENHFFIIVNKPPGMSVHNQAPSLVEELNKLKKPIHFVSRLDQETSGLMLIAKDPELHEALAVALQDGVKQYRALLRSPWKKEEKTQTWKWALTDQAEGYKNPQGISAKRVECETTMQVVRSNQFFTEITATIATGRQHQIRKHAALANHPVVGDKRYNEGKYNKQIESFYQSSRMLLHAEKLQFTFKKKDYEFKNPLKLDQFFKEVSK
ncbi:MAG: RNA pseudouridine synthase [Bdellovibrio sp.]|nr:RNA pseudouridine synthase [Bdellovibrio sp.]